MFPSFSQFGWYNKQDTNTKMMWSTNNEIQCDQTRNLQCLFKWTSVNQIDVKVQSMIDAN